MARALGSALLRRGGDAMVHDAVAAVDAARAEPSPQRLRHLVAGHRSFGRGLRFYKARDLERAIPEHAAARRELLSGGSPFADWAALYLASCDYFKARLDLALTTLGEIEARRPQERYPSLRGQIDWIAGSMAALRGRPGEALPRFLHSRELFAHTPCATCCADTSCGCPQDRPWRGSWASTPLEAVDIEDAASEMRQMLRDFKFSERTPLWYYILAEAKALENGERLGPVGSTLVAEVLIGLVRRSQDSILTPPGWTPEGGDFKLADLLRLAGVLG